MSWNYFTDYLPPDATYIPRTWAEELWAAVTERRAFAGLTTEEFSEAPPANLFLRAFNAGAWMNPVTKVDYTTFAKQSFIESELGHAVTLSPFFGASVQTVDLWNATRALCNLYTHRQFMGYGTRWARRGQAAGVSSGVPGVSGPGLGQVSWADSRDVAWDRMLASELTYPSNTAVTTSGYPSGWAGAALNSTAFELNDYDEEGNYWNFHEWQELSGLPRPSFPAALTGKSLDLYATLQLTYQISEWRRGVILIPTYESLPELDRHELAADGLSGDDGGGFDASYDVSVAFEGDTPVTLSGLTGEVQDVLLFSGFTPDGTTKNLEITFEGTPTPPPRADGYFEEHIDLNVIRFYADLSPHFLIKDD